MKLQELRQKIAEKHKAMTALVTRAETENRDLSDVEKTDFDAMKSDVTSLKARVARLEDLDGDGSDADVDDADDANERSITRDPQRPFAPSVHTRKHTYLLTRAIGSLMNKRPLEGLEREWSREMEIRSGKSPQGFYVPHHFGDEKRDAEGLLMRRSGEPELQTRALTTITGGGAVGTITEPTLIEYLYNRMVLGRAGATMMSGMSEKFSLPRTSVTSTAYWFTEGNAPQPSNLVLDQVAFIPQSIGAYSDISRKFILQTSIDAERFVRNDLARNVGLGIDQAGLVGTGTNAQPLGIVNNPNTPVYSLGANSGPMTWAGVTGLETDVATANADVGKLAYVTSARGRGSLKNTPKIGNTFPVYLADDQAQVNSYPLVTSNQIPVNFTQGTATGLTALIFGNWEDLIVAMFGATDVLVDPYTGGTSGTVRIITMQDCDIHARHDQSFAIALFSPN